MILWPSKNFDKITKFLCLTTLLWFRWYSVLTDWHLIVIQDFTNCFCLSNSIFRSMFMTGQPPYPYSGFYYIVTTWDLKLFIWTPFEPCPSFEFLAMFEKMCFNINCEFDIKDTAATREKRRPWARVSGHEFLYNMIRSLRSYCWRSNAIKFPSKFDKKKIIVVMSKILLCTLTFCFCCSFLFIYQNNNVDVLRVCFVQIKKTCGVCPHISLYKGLYRI